MRAELERLARDRRYEMVFLIENLGRCETNTVRREALEEALDLEKRQEDNYKKMGFEVVRVPAMPVNDRIEIILQNIGPDARVKRTLTCR